MLAPSTALSTTCRNSGLSGSSWGCGLVGVARAYLVVTLPGLLRGHLRPDAAGLPVVEDSWPSYEHVNVQTALDVWLAAPGVEHDLVGVTGLQHRQFGLAELLASEAG